MTKKEYGNFFYGALYKKPWTMVITFGGLALLLVAELEFSGRLYVQGMPWVDLGLAVFLILSPSLTVLLAKKRFASSLDLSNDFRFTFGEDAIVVNTKTCDATLKLEHIIKVKETRQFLLLFAGAKSAYFIKRDRLTKEQIEFIKSKVVKKK
ncbi:MAG TPA: YcxB family protein [Chitinophagaceae bacterium]